MNAFSVTVEPDEVIRVAVTGDWSIRRGLPALTAIRQSLMRGSKVRQITIDAVNLLKWDSALLAFLFSVEAICREHGAQINFRDLPQDASGLLQLALSDQRPLTTQHEKSRRRFVTWLGENMLREAGAVARLVAFFGENSLALLRLLRGRARYRSIDLLLTIEECGARAEIAETGGTRRLQGARLHLHLCERVRSASADNHADRWRHRDNRRRCAIQVKHDPGPDAAVGESNQVTFGCDDSRDRQCGTRRAYGAPQPACGALDGRTGARKFVPLCADKEPPHELRKRWYDALLPRRGTVFCFVTSAWH